MTHSISDAKYIGLMEELRLATKINGFNQYIRKPAEEEVRLEHEEVRKAQDQIKSEDEDFRIPLEDTIESHLYRITFERSEQQRAVIDQAFREYDPDLGYWRTLQDQEVLQMLLRNAKKSYYEGSKGGRKYQGKASFAKAALEHAAIELFHKDDLENTSLRAFKNGTVNLKTGKLEPHRADNYLTSAIASEYIEGRPCPDAMLRYIASSFGEENAEYVRAAISLVLDPTAPNKFVHAVGPSGSGKGVFARLLMKMFGQDSVRTESSFASLAHPDKRHQILQGCSLFVIDDITGFVGDEIGSFYTAVERTPMTGRSLFSSHAYNKAFNIRYVVCSTGPIPTKSSTTRGWTRRVFPLPTQAIEQNDQSLERELECCIADIISWALSMDKAQRDAILADPGAYNENAARYLEEADLASNSIHAFIDACLQPAEPEANDTEQDQSRDSESGQEVTSGLLYDWYRAFCFATGLQANGMPSFVSQLRQALPANHIRRTNSGKTPARWAYLKRQKALVAGDHGIWSFEKALAGEGGLKEFRHWAKQWGSLYPFGSNDLAKLNPQEPAAPASTPEIDWDEPQPSPAEPSPEVVTTPHSLEDAATEPLGHDSLIVATEVEQPDISKLVRLDPMRTPKWTRCWWWDENNKRYWRATVTDPTDQFLPGFTPITYVHNAFRANWQDLWKEVE